MRKKILLLLTIVFLLITQISLTTYATETTNQTTEIKPIGIATNNPEKITPYNVILSGIIKNLNKEEISEVGIFFGETEKNISYKIPQQIKSTEKRLTYTIDFIEETNMKLTPETKYYYRCYAIINDTIYYGRIKNFTTSAFKPFTNHNGYIYNNNLNLIKGASKIGIDVSFWQGNIDWKKVKEDGIDFVIIRCGFGMNTKRNDDKQFENNIQGCIENDIPFGVYIYSYATNVGRAKSEAEHVLRLLNGCKLDYPVYYDIEDESIKNLPKAQLAANAKTFCSIIKKAGYEVGIYSGWHWWQYKLTDPFFQNISIHKWLAAWEFESIDSNTYKMWQYTDQAIIDGIEGTVDLNIYFEDIPELINFEDRALLLKDLFLEKFLLKNIDN